MFFVVGIRTGPGAIGETRKGNIEFVACDPLLTKLGGSILSQIILSVLRAHDLRIFKIRRLSSSWLGMEQAAVERFIVEMETSLSREAIEQAVADLAEAVPYYVPLAHDPSPRDAHSVVSRLRSLRAGREVASAALHWLEIFADFCSRTWHLCPDPGFAYQLERQMSMAAARTALIRESWPDIA